MEMQKEKIYTIDDIYALPDGKRAELIDGAIYDMTLPNRKHIRIFLSHCPESLLIILTKKAALVKFTQRRLPYF